MAAQSGFSDDPTTTDKNLRPLPVVLFSSDPLPTSAQPGVYFLTLEADGQRLQRRVVKI